MNCRLEIENRAAKQIRDMSPSLRKRVIEALDALRADPRPPGCIKLKGQTRPAWRMRVGDHRILYRITDEDQTVRVYGVLRRDEAYRD